MKARIVFVPIAIPATALKSGEALRARGKPKTSIEGSAVRMIGQVKKLLAARRERDASFTLYASALQDRNAIYAVAGYYSLLDSWPANFRTWAASWVSGIGAAELEALIVETDNSSLVDRVACDGVALGRWLRVSAFEETTLGLLPLASPELTEDHRAAMRRERERLRKRQARSDAQAQLLAVLAGSATKPPRVHRTTEWRRQKRNAPSG